MVYLSVTIGLKDEHYRVRILRCPSSGVVCEETWETPNGDLHRLDGPAVIRRDRATGNITHSGYWVDGHAHRSEGKPAAQEHDPISGQCIWRSFSVEGQYERPNNLPHCEFLSVDAGVVYRAEYRLWNGSRSVLHREDGPAVLIFDRSTGEPVEVQFYRNGRKQIEHGFAKPEIG